MYPFNEILCSISDTVEFFIDRGIEHESMEELQSYEDVLCGLTLSYTNERYRYNFIVSIKNKSPVKRCNSATR